MLTNIIIKKSQVKYDSGYNTFIKLPRSDWQLRVSNKFVYPRGNGYSVGIIDTFTYRCTKDNGRHEKEMSGVDVLNRFDKYNAASIVQAKQHTPQKLKPKKEVEIDDDLFR